MGRRISERLLAWLYPDRCLMCARVIETSARLCDTCMPEAPYIRRPMCKRCGRPRGLCMCRGHRRHFERAVAPFLRTDVMRSAVSVLKQKAARDVVYAFAYEMAEAVRREYGDTAFDMVTYVPLTRRDRRRRGHNQSELLARELARELGMPCVKTLKKIVQNRPQKELKAHERIGNVMGVYDTCTDVRDKFILLVDDVITTGSTLNECAKMLRLGGARQVFVVTAVAVPPSEKNEEE